jgi:hypothetical protein
MHPVVLVLAGMSASVLNVPEGCEGGGGYRHNQKCYICFIICDYLKHIRRRGYRRKGKLMTTENYHLQQSLVPFLGMRFYCRGFEKFFKSK